MASNNVKSPYFIALQNRPSSIISVNTAVSAMPVNDNNNTLLFCPDKSFVIIDEQGNKLLNIQRNFKVSDMCFSSFLQHFLILSMEPDDYALYSLDSSKHDVKQIIKSNRIMWSCTCYDTTFIISDVDNNNRTSIIVYDLRKDWTSVKTFTTPSSCELNHQIEKIRFNSDGSRLGMILRQKSELYYQYWFELRDPIDMTAIIKTNIDPNNDKWCWLLALPNQQFLATLWREKKFFLFDSDGKLQETTGYDKNVKYLNSVALINDKYLVVQTWKPDELRFYKL